MSLVSTRISQRCAVPTSDRIRLGLFILILGFGGTAGAYAEGGVTFTDIAADHGLAYSRTVSANIAVFDQLSQLPVFTLDLLPASPLKPHGAPGVALLDFEGDGDLDIYVTNGPGTANSLFVNQLHESGNLGFLEGAAAAGLEATDQDSSGVCFGDTDNDGDRDLLVLSPEDDSRFFINRGDGTFADASAAAGFGGAGLRSTSCSFGDVDGDGLLDVAISNTTVDWANSLGIVVPFDFNQHNQIFINRGGNVFEDVTATSGIRNTRGFFPPLFDGQPTLSWAIALVDIDGDGDVDLVHADDQGGVPFARDGGVDRGLIHVFENDGSGFFTDTSAATATPGAWMGLAFGDLDGDDRMDLFGSNLGDYATTPITSLDPVYGDFAIYFLGDLASRWFLGDGHGGFSDPGVGDLVATTFGWGASISDLDNDADLDIVFHGGLYFGPIAQGSPGNILLGDGAGGFRQDALALAQSTDHELRNVQGVATGDLDRDGFVDIVSVSNFDIPADGPLAIYNHGWGSSVDFGRYTQIFRPIEPLGSSVFSGVELELGSLSVEISSGNDNRSFAVRTLGSIGLTAAGKVNRDGIGAIVTASVDGRRTSRPVVGGASYASQDSLELVFGMAQARRSSVEVLWPGGVRNRLRHVRPGERIVFPEIPCSFDADWPSFGAYLRCVKGALGDLVEADAIDRRTSLRLLISAIDAFFRP